MLRWAKQEVQIGLYHSREHHYDDFVWARKKRPACRVTWKKQTRVRGNKQFSNCGLTEWQYDHIAFTSQMYQGRSYTFPVIIYEVKINFIAW